MNTIYSSSFSSSFCSSSGNDPSGISGKGVTSTELQTPEMFYDLSHDKAASLERDEANRKQNDVLRRILLAIDPANDALRLQLAPHQPH